jgi:transposase-like protein
MQMTLMEFQRDFGTEEQCRAYLFQKRWPDGFRCPKCGHAEHFSIKSRNLYQCKACNHQASVTAGTIMDKTRTPLTKWFTAIYLLAGDKRGASALGVGKAIGVSYFTAWTMCQKIRHAMGERDERYRMSGTVEMDEAFFGAADEGGKRGRGAEKTAVMVSVSLTGDGKPGFARKKTVDSVDGAAALGFAEATVAKGSEIRTDGLNIYPILAKSGYKLVQIAHDPKKRPEHLHWTHIVISNAKAFIDGTFHGLDGIHIQRYLDEFCYRFNRRWLAGGVFPRLVAACACSSKITCHELIG